MMNETSNPPATLADVAAAIRVMADLSPVERRDLLSALSRTCAILRRPAEAVPANVRQLGRLFDSLAPVALGITAKSLANIRSGLFRAIELSGLAPIRRNRRVAWTGPWAELDTAVRAKGEKLHRLTILRRFGTWCCERGIGPADVDDLVLATFAEEDEQTAIRHRNTITRDIARRWNGFAAERPELGLKPLAVPDIVRRHRRVHLQSLPDSFRLALDEYRAFLECRDPLAEHARARPLRPASVESALQGLLTVANAAVASGIDPARITSPDVLTEVEVARAALKGLLARSGGKTTGGLERTRKMLLAYTRYLYRDEPAKITPLKAVLGRVPPMRVGMTEKNALLLRETDDPDVRARLLGLPRRLHARGMKRLASGQRSGLADVQTAIAIEILLLHALRRQNLVHLSWSRHIVWFPGQRSPTRLLIPGEEMKNGEEMTREIGESLARMLVEYRLKVLPAVVAGAPDAVFCRPDGRPLSGEALVRRIRLAVWELAGIRMTPHQFRHLSAVMILDEQPEAYELARDHLGHASSTITARYYAGRRPLQASRLFAKIIEQARAEGEAAGRTVRRKRSKATARPTKRKAKPEEVT